MSANNIVVAIYDAHSEAEQAVRELSIVTKNPHAEHSIGLPKDSILKYEILQGTHPLKHTGEHDRELAVAQK